MKKRNALVRFLLIATIFSLSFAGCVDSAHNTVYAPVVEAGKTQVEQKTYIVQPGDTLYSIAWAFELDFRQLVNANHLTKPYAVSVGQTLKLVSTASIKAPPEKRPSAEKAVTMTVLPYKKTTLKKHWNTKKIGSWLVPARGKRINIFSEKYGSSGKGIEIYGKVGEPVKAAATGTVVYSGDGLRHYGNLLLIKHNDVFLSAYAFNQRLLVKTGDKVKQGQRIATMGKDNRDKAVLYFEIRKYGKPVNPARYLS